MRSVVPSTVLLLALLVPAARAQHAAEIAAERERIAAERSRVEAEFSAAQKGCYQRFAVTDCIEAARAKRRDALADLRRQEVALNDMERKARAAERLRRLEERQVQEDRDRAQAEERRAREEPARQQRQEQKAQEAARPRQGKGEPQAQPPRQVDVEENRRRHAERLREAAEHKAKVQERAAREQKQAAPLPVPAN